MTVWREMRPPVPGKALAVRVDAQPPFLPALKRDVQHGPIDHKIQDGSTVQAAKDKEPV